MPLVLATVGMLLFPFTGQISQSRELGITLDKPVQGLAVSGQLRTPARARTIRGVIVIVNWGLSRGVYESPRWRELADSLDCAMLLATFEGSVGPNVPAERQAVRNAAVGGGDGVLLLLERLARELERPELKHAPLLFWGFSASGNFGTTFALRYPERTIGLVRFQSNLRGIAADPTTLKDIPYLLIAGGADQTAGVDDSERMWKAGRAIGAPWTFVIQPGQQHGEGLGLATAFTLSWIARVFELRMGGSTPQPVDQSMTWHGDNRSFAIAAGPAGVDASGTSWLPDKVTAELWRQVAGASK